MDSIVSLKVKTTKGKGVGTRSLVRSTSRVEGRVGAPRWDYDEWKAGQLFTWIYTNQTTSWLVHSWSTFHARMSHGQTWIHKIHHGLDLGEATTFSLIILFVPSHKASTQMSFCSKTRNLESQNSLNWVSHNFGFHNVVCRPPIEMRSKEKF
jgi:hypothetical protein